MEDGRRHQAADARKSWIGRPEFAARPSPECSTKLKNSPENLALTFKVYHNLDALTDVFTSVVESAGAFGTKDEFQSLNNDLSAIQDSRRAFAERMDKLANAKEAELAQLRTALQQARADAAPKKDVVDDNCASAKKPAVHKKPAANPTPAKLQPATPATPPATPPVVSRATLLTWFIFQQLSGAGEGTNR